MIMTTAMIFLLLLLLMLVLMLSMKIAIMMMTIVIMTTMSIPIPTLLPMFAVPAGAAAVWNLAEKGLGFGSLTALQYGGLP